MHSKMFKKIKKFYDEGTWPISWVRDAVEKRKITPAEFEEITGKVYEE